MAVIFQKSSPGKNRLSIPDPKEISSDKIPEKFLNKGLDLPDVSEIEAVRHYTKLSRMNFGVDTGMYPLGSCTMKYNPKINEKLSSLKGFTDLHPLSGDEDSQGIMQVLFELSDLLSGITGMDRFSFAPAAGSHGELAGVMIIKKYFEDIGEKRKTIIIPDAAHGTNPASVAMCGFEVKEVPSTSHGDVDIDKLKEIINEDTAAMMLTSPNTLGLFDPEIIQISEILHKNGSLFYCDGANLNAVIGRAKITAMGFDLMHINLHKTFSTPHGGGGPGSGPIGVTKKLIPYLPVPFIENKNGRYFLDYNYPKSIGRLHSFYGNVLIALRAYIYIKILGAKGIREVSDTAVLNANYLCTKLKKYYNLPYDRLCMHEFVLNDQDMPNHITTNNIAKRLLDLGFHAPTVYFPLIVDGAMMIEPTETETRESLDSFIDAMIRIRKEAEESPDILKKAPQNTPVKKVDAVLAARKPVLKWQKV